ncbi:prolyl oligopeptidase family serine peptidase [Novosphingobium lentum]|nr:prolyl oligopeptidase family serine peptidase [Novosphingobium lentum]
MNALKITVSSAAFLAVAALSPAAAAGESKGRPWTLEDILLVPKVNEIALSDDGRFALYAVEAADETAGRPRASVRIVDLTSRMQRELGRVDMAKSLKPIPGTRDWSALLDMGSGLQLYRISAAGSITPLMLSAAPLLVGRADLAVPVGGGTPPHRVGVLAYDWSPDGRWLWYTLLKAAPDVRQVRFDGDADQLRNRRRSSIAANVEYYLRDPDGQSHKVLTRPSNDRMAMHAGADILWRGDEIEFRIETPDGTAGGAFEVRAWDRRRMTMRTLANERDVQTLWILKGPRGGELSTEGFGDRPELIETVIGGKRRSYGPVGFTIGDLRSAGIQFSTDGRRVVLGTRSTSLPRYGLALLDRRGVRPIESAGSLTRCGFDSALTKAVCVEESMTRPPQLVRIDLSGGKIEPVASISPRHDEIAPLDAQPRIWINRDGYKASGYVVRPRGYKAGHRYPAIIVTHGGDADERFFDAANQWNYPVQLFAERGYVVLLINDPSPRQAEALEGAYRAWMRGSGPPGPEALQQLVFINGVHSFEDAISQLTKEGLVDADRVGIAGYSRGAQMVNVAVTQSTKFRAASSGDGGLLEPSGYATARDSYDAIYGGSPLGGHLDQYRRFAPSLNAPKICAAVLQQVAAASPSQFEFYDAMRAAGVPTQISYYPGKDPASDETHLFHIPANRLNAMRENIAWFDYWLLGKRDPDAPFPDRLTEWDRMAGEPRRHCGLPVPDQRPATPN